MADHGGQTVGIIRTTYIGAALIPKESLDGVFTGGLQHAVVHDHRLEHRMAFLVVTSQAQIHIGITLQDRFGQPAFYGRTTPTAIDDADRHIEYLG